MQERRARDPIVQNSITEVVEAAEEPPEFPPERQPRRLPHRRWCRAAEASA